MAKNSVEILIRARDGATQTLKEVQQGIKTVGDEAKAGIRPLSEYRDELEQQAKQLEETARSQDRTTEEYRTTVDALARVKGELQNVNGELDKQAAELEKTAALLDEQAKSWDQMAASAGTSMMSIGTKMSLGITAPLTALAGWGIKMAMELETFQASLDVLIGDAERAQTVFDELYEFSASTPFQWDSLTEGTRVLAAFGTEAEDIVPTLSRLGDVAAGVATPIEDLAQIYGRVQLTGRLAMEEVNRLADRGIPIYSELASILEVTEGEIRDLVSTGKIGFPELEQVFQNLTSEGGMFFGMMDAQLDTVAGRLNALKDNFGIIVDIIGQHLIPTFDAMIGAAQSLVDWFVNLDESTQGLFVGLGIALAATGPLMVGIGALLVNLPRLVAGFQLLRTTMLPFLGPLGLVVALSTVLGTLAKRYVESDEALQTHKSWIDEVAGTYEVYRAEIYATTEAERQGAIDRLDAIRTEMQERLSLLQELAEAQRSSVQGFLDSPIGKFLMPGWLNIEGSASYGTLDEMERLGTIIGQIGSDIDKLTSGAARVVEIEVTTTKPPPVEIPVDVTFTGPGADLVDEETARGFIARLVDQLGAGLDAARDGWRDTLTNFGVITGTLLRDAFGVDQPDSELVTLGKDIISAIGDGIEEAFPSLGARLGAGVTAIKDSVANAALQAYVVSGGALVTPDSTYTPFNPDPYVPDLIGIGGRPTPRDVAGYESNLAQMSEAMFGPRSAAGRFLADLETLFTRAAREMARADRVAGYEADLGFQRGQDARFGSPDALAAYHARVVYDPRSAGFRRDITAPAPFAGLPDARELSLNPFAQVPAPVALGITPTAQVMPDLSHLDDDKREQILAEEMAARAELVSQLTTMSTENGPLANFGTQLLAAAAEAVPAFGAALDGFVQAGPVGAIIGFFTELLMASEPVQEAFLMINEALAPLGELLGRIIAPALRVLGTVIGWVVDALVAIYNFLLGWLLGRIEPRKVEEEEETVGNSRRVYDHSPDPPASREMDFGRVSPGVQLAVSTPLVEAAQLFLTGAQLEMAAANSLSAVVGRMEAMYDRVLTEGFRVVVESRSPSGPTQSETAFMR